MAKKKGTKGSAVTIDDQLRAAILASEHKAVEIARRTGISPGMLSRFLTDDMDARRDLRLATAAKIAAFLELELRPARH